MTLNVTDSYYKKKSHPCAPDLTHILSFWKDIFLHLSQLLNIDEDKYIALWFCFGVIQTCETEGLRV